MDAKSLTESHELVTIAAEAEILPSVTTIEPPAIVAEGLTPVINAEVEKIRL